MTPNQYRLGLLIGHLGRTQKIKTEGATITVAKIAQELEISAQDVTDLLLLAREKGLIELAIASAMVKILPEPSNAALHCPGVLEIVEDSEEDWDRDEELNPLDIKSDASTGKKSGKSQEGHS
jgi:hypothetical protein